MAVGRGCPQAPRPLFFYGNFGFPSNRLTQVTAFSGKHRHTEPVDGVANAA
jgi:hypothetical protein